MRHSLPFQVVAALEYLDINIYFCPQLYMPLEFTAHIHLGTEP